MSKITNIFFSPSETTKKVLNQMASNFSKDYEICDLLYFDGEKEFSSDDIVLVGMPVYLQEEFLKLQGIGYPN